MACCALLAVMVGVILAILMGRNPRRRHNADALKWRLHTRDKDESE